MELQKPKISLNTSFDFHIFKLILKKNWYWTILIFAFFGAIAFLYLRYTKPIYESKILIQIQNENQSEDIFGFKEVMGESSLSKDIEIIKSQRLFNKTINDLPLDVSYYNKGEFLTENKYKSSGYEVIIGQVKDSSIFNQPIYVTIIGDEIGLSFNHKGKSYEYNVTPNAVMKTPFFDALITIEDIQRFKSEVTNNKIYFEINNFNTIARRIYGGVSIDIINQNARTVEISCRNENISLARDVVSTLTHNFFNYYDEIKKESVQNILSFIDVQLDSLSKELLASKDSVLQYRRDEKIVGKESVGTIIQSRLELLNDEEEKVTEDKRILEIVKQKINNQANSLEIYKILPDIIGQTFVGSLTTQIQDLYRLLEEKENLSYKITGDNEKIKRLEKQIDFNIEIINNLIELVEDKNQEKLKYVQERRQELEAQYSQLPQKQMELDRLMSIQSLNDKFYSTLTEKKVIYSISNAGFSSDNKILNDATASGKPVYPIRPLAYGIAIFLSVLFSGMLIVLKYLTFNQISRISDLQRIIPKNVGAIGTIPHIKHAGEYSSLLVDERPKSKLTESFRNIRVNLSFLKKDYQTIAVSSTISGEGKTFVALNLAGVIAMTGKKVIVIDLDLRKPKVHLGFGVNNDLGMSQLLAGHYTLDEVVINSRVEGLDFISAGPIPPNPSELILSMEFESVLAQLKEIYDVIIFDTPPVGIVSDGIRLLSKIDIPIYVFRSNYSKRYFIDKLYDIAKIDEVKNLSIVLNGADVKNNVYGGYESGYYQD